MNYKQLSAFLMLLTIALSNVNLQAQSTQKKQQRGNGRERYFTIMYDGQFGISTFNKNVVYAQTENLTQDAALAASTIYFPTLTDGGQTFLFDTLQYPVSPKDKSKSVEHRKHAIKVFVENNELHQKVTDLLIQAKEAEEAVMELMNNRQGAIEKIKMPELSDSMWDQYVLKPYYWWQHYTNTSALGNLQKQAVTAASVGTLAFGAVAQAQMAKDAWKENNAWDETGLKSRGWLDEKRLDKAYKLSPLPDSNTIKNYTTVENYIPNQKMLDKKIQTLKDSQDIAKNWVFSDSLNDSYKYAFGAGVSAYGAYSASKGVYDEYQTGLKNRILIHELGNMVKIAEQMEQLCKHHGIVHQFKPSLIRDAQAQAMLNKLKDPLYENKEESWTVWTPWINTFIYEIYEQDTYLAPFFALIAEMDAYHAIAQRFIDNAQKPNQFCFAQVLHQKKPKIEAHDFWNVILARPVTNTLVEDRNIILTGPNAGGKSTVIRSILQNLIFSQTFGFAAGTHFASTPFDLIESSLRVQDDILKGQSRYAAELQRGMQTALKAKELRPDEKFFFVLDELFTGTNNTDGQIAAYELVNDDFAAKSDQILFIFATHFDKLKEIEQNNPTKFANYKIDAPITNEQGQLIYPFTLSKGANNISIALQMKKIAGLKGDDTAKEIAPAPIIEQELVHSPQLAAVQPIIAQQPTPVKSTRAKARR